MLEAITGVPDANASVRTIPKLSPASEGAQRTSAVKALCQSSSLPDAPERLDARECRGVGDVALDVRRGSTPTTVSVDGHVLDQGLERRQQHRQALALLGAADEQHPELLRLAASGRAGGASTSTPLGITS